MRTVLLERSDGNEHGPSRSAVDLRPGGVQEICHRVLNYPAGSPDRARGEEKPVSITPEQLERTAVEPEPDEAAATPPRDDELVVEDLLVEDVSIDGMCGVY
jgi:mycofactocin precursor